MRIKGKFLVTIKMKIDILERNLFSMKKNIIVLMLTIAIIVLVVSSLIVYAKSDEQSVTLEEKVSQEIYYLDNYIISLLGKFNGLNVGNDIFQIGPQKNNIGNSTQSSKSEQKVTNTTEQNQSGQGNMGGSENKANEQSGQDNNVATSDENQAGSANTSSEGGGLSEQGGGTQNQSGQSNASQGQNDRSGKFNIEQNSILANNGVYTTQWESIKLQIESLYQAWNTITIDLHALNIEGNSILAFSDALNNATKHIKEEDKEKAMTELIKMHELLPKYKESYNKDGQETKILSIVTQVLKGYMNVTVEKWQEAEENLSEAEKQFANILNSVNTQSNPNQVVMNQCYILVNELKSAIRLQDKDIFFIQYQNFINKIEILLAI